ncbi:MAG: transketolase, partial [Pseudomonadota bacterium]|nr:transketolase [Pseudomonadota bacterium]
MSATCCHQVAINHLKGIVIDAVQRAQSGHIGGALSAMDVVYYLFTACLRYDPDNPDWLLRDKFILSAGHASMLVYSMLYAIGYLKRQDLQAFRQLKSRTPGHPELETTGVECTTGQLGQGASMAVGFAIARLHHRHSISPMFDQQIVALLGDGCMQEDITLSSASYAGHLALPNLTWIYDRNSKQISGDTSMVESNDWEKLYQAYGWQVISIDGHDHRQINAALGKIHAPRTQPLLIISNTTLGNGMFSAAGNHIYHGMPLPTEEAIKTKQQLNLPSDEQFYFPDSVRQTFQRNFAAMRTQVQGKKQALASLRTSSRFKFHYHADVNAAPTPRFSWGRGATRDALGRLLAHYAEHLPLIGGSADLNDPARVSAFISQVGEFNRHRYHGRGLQFGVREMPMSAICNGIAIHGGYLVFDATFLCFADYSRAALRSGAIQKAQVMHIFTHDSFFLGEDGATHQPIEQLMSLRAMPNLDVARPADGTETEALFHRALVRGLPTAFCLTRQQLP